MLHFPQLQESAIRRQKVFSSLCILILLLASFLLSIQAGCPDPPVTEGYLGNVGTTSGNCQNHPLPPLCAFGSLSINQNGPLESVNRLNPTQLPTTNNFQLFQNPCAVNVNVWSFDAVMFPSNSLTTGGGVLKMRCGPFLVGMARTGPTATMSIFNHNVNAALPNLTADARATFFFSASEGTASYFNISTDVVNAQTCAVTYTPISGAAGKMVDYNVIGSAFHDVYYDNLHPEFAFSNPLLTEGNAVYMVVDPYLAPTPGTIQLVPFGGMVTGKSFLFFVKRYDTLGPAIFLLYAVDNGDNPVTLTLTSLGMEHFFISMSQPYTGFFRLAAISSNDAAPTLASVGMPWIQTTYFMPEDIANMDDTSKEPPTMTCAANQISTCAIETMGCCLTPIADNWWTTAQVHAIAPTGMNFYMLLPTIWANSFTSLASKVIGPTWSAGALKPTTQALTDILPAIAMSNPALASTYYSNFFTALNPTNMAPFTDGSDFATNFFLVQFDMFMAEQLIGDIGPFQSTSRALPSYSLAPLTLNNIQVYNDHRRYVPVKADITTTASSMQWTYTLSPDVPPGDGQNKTLVCFPFWKYLQGLTPGMVDTMTGAGHVLQNFIYHDTIKGTLYTAEAINGAVTFLEGGIPSWYGPDDFFFPSSLMFNGTQMSALGTAFSQLGQEIVPLPYFPETRIDDSYNAGKTCYMLAKSGLYIAKYLQQALDPQIVAKTRPYIDNAKSVLTAFLVGRTPGGSFFVADRTSGGICVNGAGGDGTWAKGPNLQQSVDSGVDFGNYVYNDHHFFAGYFITAAAMVTDWEMRHTPGSPLWIDLPVVGGDGHTYKIRDMIDFLWRDTHNPFTNDSTQTIYDPDLPYNRYGFPWEGHGIANGLQYQPNALGRNQESISEDFNCWLGINAYANLVLKTTLTGLETLKYQTLRDFSLMNLKMMGSAGILWFKNTAYWKGENMYITQPNFVGPAIHVGQFTQATVTNGQVNDNSAQNQTFF